MESFEEEFEMRAEFLLIWGKKNRRKELWRERERL